MAITIGSVGQQYGGCRVSITSLSLTPGNIYDFRFVATDSCHFEGRVNEVKIVTLYDCSIGHGWVVDGGGSPYGNGASTGQYEETYNDGTTDTGNTTYANSVYSIYAHQANYNYIASNGAGPYADQMHKLGSCQQAAHVGTTLNYSGLFYAFVSGTYRGTAC